MVDTNKWGDDVTDNILQFPTKTKDVEVDTRKLTLELIGEYREVILLVAEHGEALTREDYIHAYGMMLNFNHLLLGYINEMGE